MRTVSLPRSLDVSVVHAIANDLVEVIAQGPLVLDASGIVKLDAAGLQLLCAAVTTARAQGVPVRWTAVSPTLADGARTLALGQLLGLEETR